MAKAFDPPLDPSEVAAAFADRYDTLRPLKSGGQGAVFRARCIQAGPDVALKVLFPGELQERTNREIATMQTLRVPQLVELREHGKIPLRGASCTWIATSFIDGESLATTISRGPLTDLQTARIAEHVGDAIRTLWRERIVHRDLKPDNIMITPNGGAVVIDLGIARHVDMSPLTTTGKAWGTHGYYSPEQMQAIRALTCRSDVFALGIVLQECLLGRHPTGGDQMALVKGGPRTAGLRAGISAALISLIDSMVDARVVYRPLPRSIVERARAIIASLQGGAA